MIFNLIVLFLIVSFLISWLYPDPEPVFNKYSRRGKWYYLKYLFMRICLYINKKRFKDLADRRANQTQGVLVHKFAQFKVLRHPFNQISSSSVEDRKKFEEMYERPQPLSDSPWAFDACWFMAGNSQGFYLAGGMERRNHRISNGLLYLVVKSFGDLNFSSIDGLREVNVMNLRRVGYTYSNNIPGKGLLQNSHLPKTALYPAEEGTFNVKGFHFSAVEPMKKWVLLYDGDMKSEDGKVYRVHFKGTWTSDQPWFSYDTDLHPHLIASALSLEPWNRAYFDNLKKAHQNHYEQIGDLQVSLVIDDSLIEISPTRSFRDHSFGLERNWNLMHRFAAFMMFLENGHTASIMAVCQPATCSRFYIGHVNDGKGETVSIEWCDFELYQHGEAKMPPLNVAFQFGAGGKTYTAEIIVEYRADHLKGLDRQIQMFESFFRCKVNGVPGNGVCEFLYHNEHVPESDVDAHVQEIIKTPQ